MTTCGLRDPLAPVRGRVASSPYPFALVISEHGVLLGRLPASTLDREAERRAAEVMDPGPKTYRPHKTAAGTAEELGERDLRWAIVTTPEGVLIGVATRADLEAAAARHEGTAS